MIFSIIAVIFGAIVCIIAGLTLITVIANFALKIINWSKNLNK